MTSAEQEAVRWAAKGIEAAVSGMDVMAAQCFERAGATLRAALDRQQAAAAFLRPPHSEAVRS